MHTKVAHCHVDYVAFGNVENITPDIKNHTVSRPIVHSCPALIITVNDKYGPTRDSRLISD